MGDGGRWEGVELRVQGGGLEGEGAQRAQGAEVEEDMGKTVRQGGAGELREWRGEGRT